MFTLKRPDRSRKLSVARSAVRHADTQSITPEDEKTNKKLRKVPAKTGFR
uniref:Uncharacterized protein n=1 Tax=Caenorhabditis japonica TaxID=281687 RepID=A0A8R1EJD7_CAEJA